MRHAVNLNIHGNEHPCFAYRTQIIVADANLVGTVIGYILEEIEECEQTQRIVAVTLKTLDCICVDLFLYHNLFSFYFAAGEIAGFEFELRCAEIYQVGAGEDGVIGIHEFGLDKCYVTHHLGDLGAYGDFIE